MGYFRHRILGTVNLDAPFLGLHPGIIVSGISSLFRPKQKPAKESTTELDSSPGTSGMVSPISSVYSTLPGLSPTVSTLSTESRTRVQGFPFPAMTFDPNFNPSYSNDVRLQDRGWWQNIAHFVRKHHTEGIIDAATQHFMSHLEYGSTLLDFNCLKSRYEGLRKLEDLDDFAQDGLPYGPRRVRFIQYYTMCYGLPKKPKAERTEKRPETSEVVSPTLSLISTPRISVQDHSRSEVQTYLLHPGSSVAGSHSSDLDTDQLKFDGGQPERGSSQEGESSLSTNEATSSQTIASSLSSPNKQSIDTYRSTDASLPRQRPSVDADTAAELADAVSALHLDLPVVPELQPKPEMPDLSDITNKDDRKQAEKEARRKQKAYEQAAKTREKAIRERQKIIDKREKKRLQEAEKKQKDEVKLKKKEDVGAIPATSSSSVAQAPEVESVRAPTEPKPGPIRTMTEGSTEEIRGPDGKKRKERMFCSLPKTHKVNDQLDPKWVRVFMKDMDETGAHTGLFYPGEHYDRLVGDVVDVIIGWVQDDATKRAILSMN